MTTITRTTPGQTDVDINGKNNFAFQLQSSGGRGGTSEGQDSGGGGGGGYVAGSIPNADLLGMSTLSLFAPTLGDQPDSNQDEQTTLLLNGDTAVSVIAGDLGGDTGGGVGGHLNQDIFSWVSVSHTGGNGGNHATGGGTSSGSGGGSSAGPSSDGNPGTSGDTLGVSAGTGGAAVTGGGAGGNGGTVNALGTAGTSPGGGGGGGGDLAAATPALGGNAKLILTYDSVPTPNITTTSASVSAGDTVVISIAGTGIDGNTLFSITGNGTDDGLFTIVSDDVLSFSDPAVAGDYSVEVQAANGINGELTDTQTIAVTVESSEETPPTITSASSFNVTEGTTAVGTVTATGDAMIVFTLGTGFDSAKFSLNSSSGVLAFLVAPDFEKSSSYLATNIYTVPIIATNAAGNVHQTVLVKVINNAGDDPAANTLQNPVSHPVLIPSTDPSNFIYNLQRERLL